MSRPDSFGAALMILLLATIAASAAACGANGQPAPDASPLPTLAPSQTPALPSSGSDEPARRDPIDLARRLNGYTGAGEVEQSSPALGDIEEFDVIVLPVNPDQRPTFRTVTATLRAVSEHAYFYVERARGVPDSEVDDAAEAFEERIWPTVTAAFGLPSTPGVDGDPRIAILHADVGSAVGGYVSDYDRYPVDAVPHSNEREIIYMNEQIRPLGSAQYAFILGHELQHLIHIENDSDESAWVNEGLSEYAGGLVISGSRSYGRYLDQPDTQLNAWGDAGGTGVHYEKSGLFFTYLMEQTGGDVRALASQAANGVQGVADYLQAAGEPRSFADLVADWAVANLIDAPSGPYGYGTLEIGAPATIIVDMAGDAAGAGEVHQFAADYLELRAGDVTGETSFIFQGEAHVPVIAARENATGRFWRAARGDSIDATLTRELDLSRVQQATLTFRTWFDIERDFDFAYVMASRDGGRTWSTLAGREAKIDDPLGIGFGPAYSGRSGGGDEAVWVEERIDLSAYAGSRILLRFEYITDSGLNRPGWAIDDIAVPEIGFFDDAEEDAGGWRRQGFLRLVEPLAQRFELRLVTFGSPPLVREIAVDSSNRAVVPLAGLGVDFQTAVLVVVGATVGTTEVAPYRYEFTQGG
ncbi:MAG: immune inhibitor A [Chloroflexi bacterium]|nr:immune inhibitor A [Chloroflexota bacterium]